MKPTDILSGEHRIIEQVLNCLEKIAQDCEAQGRLDRLSAEQALDFLRNFADRCHHGKELTPLQESRPPLESQLPILDNVVVRT